jgi:pimeloyl-ACP methyl ester carboxylesterase
VLTAGPDIEEFRAAEEGEPQLRAFCENMRTEINAGGAEGAVAALETILSDVDKAAAKDGLGDYLFSVLSQGFRTGVDGWVDDDLEFTQPWGFDLSEIKVPILLYQGSDDKMVPYAHGQWFAKHLPQAALRAHLIEGEGHVSLVAKGAELLAELVEAVGKK